MQLIVQAPECRQQSASFGTKNMGFGEKNRNIVEEAQYPSSEVHNNEAFTLSIRVG